MRIVCMDQDSQEWFSARIGKVTASRIGDAMKRLSRASGGRVKGDYAAAHFNYVRELADEMITRVPFGHFVSKAMDYGTAWESVARAEYAAATGLDVDQTGFVLHPTLDYIGASPDGVTAEGGVEIKVPNFKTHMDYIMDDVVPEEYRPQMYLNMLCCKRPHWDFLSYCPKDPDDGERFCLPDRFRLFIKRLPADPEVFRQMEEAATDTIEEATRLVAAMNARYPASGIPESETHAQLRKSVEGFGAATDDEYAYLDARDMTP